MATEVKRRRGTTTQHDSFTGAEGEITVDLTKDTLVVHDGSTQAGFPLLREDFSNAPAEIDVQNSTIEASEFIGDLRGAVRFRAKAVDTNIAKGDAVYISGIDGNTPTVGLADADNASKMPAFGLAAADINENATGEIITFGTLSGVDTSSFSVGDILYIDTSPSIGSTLTATAPAGESAQIQNIGKVQRSDANVGSIKVGGAGRSNDTPNLNQDKIFLGDSNNRAVSTALSSIGLTSFNDDSTFLKDADFGSNGLMKRTGAGTYGIVTDNSSNWDTAYSWGDHSTAGYLTSYSETDTLSDVTGRGASTTDTVSFDKSSASSGNALRVLGAAGNIDFSYLGTQISFSAQSTITAGTNDLYLDGGQVVVDTNLYNDGDATVTGSITAGSIVKDGGSSSQFLKADGSVDGNTYLTAVPSEYLTETEGDARYLQLTGGTISSNLIISGNLTVSGTTTTINTETINLADNIILLNSNFGGQTPTESAGIEIERGADNTNKQFLWNETNDRWQTDDALYVSGALTATGNITGSSIIKSGGTSSQFLKADGSVDSSTYLTSYTETDPIFSASAASGITSGNISNWNLAYNNHITGVGFNTGTGVLTLTQNDADTITADLDGRYLELSGGTLTGSLDVGGNVTANGNSAFVRVENTSSNIAVQLLSDSSGDGQIRVNDSSGNTKVFLYGEAGGDAYFNAGGNVGIGTTSPASELDVEGTIQANNLKLQNLSTGSSDTTVLTLDAGQNVNVRTLGSNAFDSTSYLPLTGGDVSGSIDITSTVQAFRLYDGTNFRGGLGTGDWAGANFGDSVSDIVAYVSGSNKFMIGTDNQPRLTVDGSGNVGIGTTSPSQKITIGFSDNGTDGLSFRSATYANLAKILVQNESSSQNGNIQFHTRNGGDVVERMRIDTSGQVYFKSSTDYKIGLNDSAGINQWWLKSYTNGDFAIHENGVGDQLTVEAGGNVGIGTTSPVNNTPLTLQAPSGYTDTLWLKSVGTNIASRINIGPTGTGNAQINNATGTDIEFQISGSEKMRIDSSGNVGIGATSVSSGFRTEIAGGDFRVGDTQGEDAVEIGWSAGGSQGFVQAYDRGDSAFRDLMLNASLLIKGGGNVGIGETDPAQKLHVNSGTANFVAKFESTDDKASILLEDDDTLNYIHSQDGYMSLGGDSGLDVGNLNIHSTNGNVGIGSTNPSNTLVLRRASSGQTEHGLRLEYVEDAAPTQTSSAVLVGDYGLKFKNYNSGRDFVFETGNVGIGTTSPSEKLQVNGNIGFTGTARRIISNLSSGGTTRTAEIELYNGSNGAIKYMTTNSSTGGHEFYTQGTKRFEVKKDGDVDISNDLIVDGDVLVGKTSAGLGTVGHEFDSLGYAYHTRNSEVALALNRKSTDGKILEFYKDTSTVGSIGTANGDLFIGTTNGSDECYLRFAFGGVGMVPATSAGLANDNALDLGASNARFKDLYLGGDANIDGDVQFGGNTLISTDTSDASDNAQIIISGGGASGDTRGASVHISGNEHGNGGLLQLRAGSGSISQIRSYTSGTERMRIDSSGNVGIGTTSITSGFKTEISGGFLRVGDTQGEDAVEMGWFAGGNRGFIQVYDRGDSAFRDLLINDSLMIESDGDVGIGTTSPVAKFEVSDGSSSITLQEFNNGAAIFLDGSNGDFIGGDYFHIIADGVGYLGLGGYGGGATPLNINFQGNVGVGTNSPDTNLHIYDASGGATLKIASNTANAYDSSKIQMIGGNLSTSEILLGDASDSDIGRIIYRHNGNSLAFDVNAEERLRIDSNGNVGIGTSSPDAPLTVHNSSDPEIRLGYSASQDHRITWDSSKIFLDADPDNANGSSGVGLRVDGTLALFADANQNVGIGTASPVSLLHLENASSPTVRIKDTTNNVTLLAYAQNSDAHIGTYSNHDLIFDANSTEAMRINSSGSVDFADTVTISDNVAGTFQALVLNNSRSSQDEVGNVSKLSFQHNSVNAGEIRSVTTEDFTTSANRSADLSFHTIHNGTLSERLRINDDGNVGIGTTSPSYALDIERTSGEVAIQLQARDNSSNSSIYFGDNGDADVGSLIYNHGSNYMAFTANASERMRIGADGNVGIGTASPAGKLMVREDSAGNPTRIIVSNNGSVQSGTSARMSFYEGTSEKNYIERRRDGSGDFAFVSSADDNPFVFENASGEFLTFVNSRVGIGTNSPTLGKLVVKDDYIVQTDGTRNVYFGSDGTGGLIGTTTNHYTRFITNNTERMRILSGGGITFNGDTATANALDDYEEGTFTPTIHAGASNIVAHSNNYGKYTKIGNVVHCSGRFQSTSLTAGSSSTNVELGGLPFSAVVTGPSNGTGVIAGSIGFASGFSGEAPTAMQIRNNEPNAFLYFQNEFLGFSNLKGNDLGSATTIVFQITYQTN